MHRQRDLFGDVRIVHQDAAVEREEQLDQTPPDVAESDDANTPPAQLAKEKTRIATIATMYESPPTAASQP